jgi:hypothetical protein
VLQRRQDGEFRKGRVTKGVFGSAMTLEIGKVSTIIYPASHKGQELPLRAIQQQ